MAKNLLNMMEKIMDPNIIDYYIVNCAIPSIITICYQIDFGKPYGGVPQPGTHRGLSKVRFDSLFRGINCMLLSCMVKDTLSKYEIRKPSPFHVCAP